MTDADVAALLDRVPGWQGRARVERELVGGTTNRNVVIAVGTELFVLRIVGGGTELLDIDRHVEREANGRAAALGIAPEVVAFLEPEGYLVTRFVSGGELSSEQLATPERVREVAGVVRAFHASGPLGGTFDCFDIPRRHRDVAAARGVAIPAAYERAAQYAAEIEAAFAASPEAPCPCHNDLLSANFLAAGGRLWLLDWEYAGMNDRYFDLGNFAANNELDAEAETTLLVAYFGATTPRRAARLALMRIMSSFREAMWGVAQQAISTLDFDFVAYARVSFDHLLRQATRPEYRQLLADAATPEH